MYEIKSLLFQVSIKNSNRVFQFSLFQLFHRMFRNTSINKNSRAIEKYCPLEYIHPSNPSMSTQTVDNLVFHQNYGPINSLHFAGRIYHNKNAKVRTFPTTKQLRYQKDKASGNYDVRASIGTEMTRYLVRKNKSCINEGWKGYETEPEREILSYDRAVKSLNNIRLSLDPEITIFQDIRTFFTRFCEGGAIVDTVSLADFADLEGVLVDKEINERKMLNSPAQFISELRYNIAHGYNSSNQNASRTSLPSSSRENDSIDNSSQPSSLAVQPSVTEDNVSKLNVANNINDQLFEQVLDMDKQISDLKETIFINESKVSELSSVVSAVLEVTKSSLAKNNCVQSDIVVYDRIFTFKSGIQSQVYKFRENKKSKKEICECYQCELKQVCTRAQKIIEIGLENCDIEPKVFAFGKNVDGHVCENDNKSGNIELTEITSKNELGSRNLKVIEENLSVSVNICSHESRDNLSRQVLVDNKQSTPIKPKSNETKILVTAEVDETADITRPEYPESDDSSQMRWSDVLSTHEDFMSEFSDFE